MVDPAGSTWVVTPRAASRRGTLRLMPRSTAATVNRCSPCASTTYGLAVVTSADRFAPTICGERRTRSSRAAGSSSTLEMPTRIAPRSRRCRVSARVSTPLMPTTPSAASRSSSPPSARQLELIRAGSRTTYPATQIRSDSSSSPLTPVLPMCGAVCTTTCRWYEGSVSVSW